MLPKNVLCSTPRFSPKPSTTVASVHSGSDVPARADRNRRAILYDSDDDKPNERLDRKLNHDRLEREKVAQAAAKKTPLPADVSNRSRTSERSADKFRDFLGNDDDDDRRAAAPTKTAPAPKTPLPKPKDTDATRKPDATRFTALVVATPSSRKRTISPTAAGPSAVAGSHTPVLKKTRVDGPPIAYKPFRKLLDGVVLVISGIQNPERGHVRDKALALGAKYKPDWSGGCTHLM